ncbi:MAG: hypothetical protein M3235_01985 [Actinomycetota bacterium]|nr:hypothetical protein [Actinomycetota bacterium]
MVDAGTERGRRKTYRPLLAAGIVAVWIVATVAAIAASGERGADTETELVTRASDALRAGDGAAFDEVLLDGADEGFAEDYVGRLRAAGTPELVRERPGVAVARSGQVATTLSITEERGRWYLSLLPPG